MGLFGRRKKKDNDIPLIEQVFHGTPERERELPVINAWGILKTYRVDWQKFGQELQKAGILDDKKPIISIKKQLDFDNNGQSILKIVYGQDARNPKSEKTIIIDPYKASVFSTYGTGRFSDFLVNELWQKFSDTHTANNNLEIQHLYATDAQNDLARGFNLEMNKTEAEFIGKYKGCKFEYFGYEDGAPVFVKVNQHKNENSVQVSTANELMHCVLNLIPKEKLYQARDIEFFKEKCYEIAKRSAWKNDNWDDAIELLSEYLLRKKSTFAKQANQKSPEQLER